MRISDWSSDVCSSDRVAAQGANPDIHNPDRDLPGKQPGKRGPVRRNPGAGWSENPRPSAKPAKISMLPWVTRSVRSEEQTSELESLMRISYAVFCLKIKKEKINDIKHTYDDIIKNHTEV